MPLPILVDAVTVGCVPYRVSLSPEACVRRFELANGELAARASDASHSELAGSLRRLSHCAGCLVGADRAWFLLQLGGEMSTKGMGGWKLDKQCGACKRKVALLVDGRNCRKCAHPSKTGTRKARIGTAVERVVKGPPDADGARDPESPLAQYLKLHAAVEDMKARHRTELSNALRSIEVFESNNPEVTEGTRAVYDRIFASGKLPALPPGEASTTP